MEKNIKEKVEGIDNLIRQYQSQTKLTYNLTERDLQLQMNQLRTSLNVLIRYLSLNKEFDIKRYIKTLKESFKRTYEMKGISIITKYN